MVHSVLAVSAIDKVKRDVHKENGSPKQSNSLFARVLEQTEKEMKNKENIQDCYTVTYGQDSKMNEFRYQMREYHY